MFYTVLESFDGLGGGLALGEALILGDGGFVQGLGNVQLGGGHGVEVVVEAVLGLVYLE